MKTRNENGNGQGRSCEAASLLPEAMPIESSSGGGERARPARRPALDEPSKAARRLGYLSALGKEHVVAIYLNARHQELVFETVSIGTLTASLIHPREVFGPALRCSAASVLVAHNHPSGDPTPSTEDCDITRRLVRAGELLGVPLLDHIIIAEEGYFSFRERGLIKAE